MGDTPARVQMMGSGFQVGTNTISRATHIVKYYAPGKKFASNGTIQYENTSTQVKFFDFHLLVYAYSNFSTSDGLAFNIGRVNETVVKFYYKDA